MNVVLHVDSLNYNAIDGRWKGGFDLMAFAFSCLHDRLIAPQERSFPLDDDVILFQDGSLFFEGGNEGINIVRIVCDW